MTEVVMVEVVTVTLIVTLLLRAVFLYIDVRFNKFAGLHAQRFWSMVFIGLPFGPWSVLMRTCESIPDYLPIGVLYIFVVMGIISALLSLYGIVAIVLSRREKKFTDFIGYSKSSSDDDSGWIW